MHKAIPIARHRFVRLSWLPVCLTVHADTNGDRGPTGKQKTGSKTPYFSLKNVPSINLHDVMRYRMMCRFV